MKEYKVNVQKTLSVPAGVNKLKIIHEWSDIILNDVSVTASSTYNWTPDSIGVHTLTWKNNSTVISTEYVDVIAQYITSGAFFTDYDKFSDRDEEFAKFERKIRRNLESFCQQKFGPYINKSRKIQGQGGQSLYLPERLLSLQSIVDSYGTIWTAEVILSESEYFLRKKPSTHSFYSIRPNSALYDIDVKKDITRDTYDFFKESLDYIVVGDWGWNWVPQDISEAMALLIADQYSGVAKQRGNRISKAQFDNYAYEIGDFESSTGNSEADQLLAPYININLGLA